MRSIQPEATRSWQSASAIAVSLILTVLALLSQEADWAAALCVGIALSTGLLLLIVAAATHERRRTLTFVALAVYVFGQILLLSHYSLIRNQVRWLVLSRGYVARVLAQPSPADGEFRHVPWDGWGYGGQDTIAYLVFDPTHSLAARLDTRPPIKAPGLPCSVAHVSRLGRQWYDVTFYTDLYWGHGRCTTRMTRAH